MTDKVQKIKDWISKEQDGLMDANGNFDNPSDEGAFHILTNLDYYIDSLQEEPETKFKIGDRVKIKGRTAKGDVIRNIYQAEDGNTYFEFENSDDAPADLDWELVEEPKKCMYTKDDFTEEDRKILCEDCEEECEYAKKEEPVSEDLGDYINELSKRFPEVSFAKLSMIAVRVAKWQEEQDQSTIELAEDHAMLAGMEKMKEEMMVNAIDATIGLPYENKDGGYTHLIDVSRPLPVGNNKIAIIFKED